MPKSILEIDRGQVALSVCALACCSSSDGSIQRRHTILRDPCHHSGERPALRTHRGQADIGAMKGKNLLKRRLKAVAELDSPAITERRREIILSKPFLRRIYEEWYTQIGAYVPEGPGKVLEIGSGPGFFHRHLPELITSDFIGVKHVSVVLDARALPFESGALRGVVATDVLHHVNRPRSFFAETARCVRAGGRIVLIEPWNSAWSGWIYRHLHHEPFVPEAAEWEFATTGPLSGANGALPWIMFERDLEQLQNEFPQWRLISLQPFMPLRYLLSGGFTAPALVPAFTFGFWRRVDGFLSRLSREMSMFALIVLERA